MLVIYACLAGAASSVGELGKGTPDLHQGVGCPCPQPDQQRCAFTAGTHQTAFDCSDVSKEIDGAQLLC
jgi:hypothetical protein